MMLSQVDQLGKGAAAGNQQPILQSVRQGQDPQRTKGMQYLQAQHLRG